MNKIRVAVVGYGNIGQYVIKTLQTTHDMEIAGVIRRNPNEQQPLELKNIIVTDDITKLGHVDVAVLASPTRCIMEDAKKYLSLGINTVDSYDIHENIFDLRTQLDKVASNNNSVAIIASGWDPGTDSVVRGLMEACSPNGITYTNFGPGMSMGHTVSVKAIDGVEKALSMTIPLGTGMHRRIVYVQKEKEADMDKITESIKTEPYFINDETNVIEVDNVDFYMDKGHGVNMIRRGVSGVTQNQFFEFNMRIDNPALTAQILVSCARATLKQAPGAYTLIEIPIIDLLYGDEEYLIKKLV